VNWVVLPPAPGFAQLQHCRNFTWNKLYAVGTLPFPEPLPVVEQKFSWLAAKIHFRGWLLANWSLQNLREGNFSSG